MSNFDEKILNRLIRAEREIERLKVKERAIGWTYPATPLISTSWDGDTKTTADRAIVDLSAVFSVPAGVRAVLMSIQTGGDAAGDYVQFGPDSTNKTTVTCRTQVAGQRANASGIVPCDANGDIYCYPSGTVEDVNVWIWGYLQ